MVEPGHAVFTVQEQIHNFVRNHRGPAPKAYQTDYAFSRSYRSQVSTLGIYPHEKVAGEKCIHDIDPLTMSALPVLDLWQIHVKILSKEIIFCNSLLTWLTTNGEPAIRGLLVALFHN
jgi:hypothetical protein